MQGWPPSSATGWTDHQFGGLPEILNENSACISFLEFNGGGCPFWAPTGRNWEWTVSSVPRIPFI